MSEEVRERGKAYVCVALTAGMYVWAFVEGGKKEGDKNKEERKERRENASSNSVLCVALGVVGSVRARRRKHAPQTVKCSCSAFWSRRDVYKCGQQLEHTHTKEKH